MSNIGRIIGDFYCNGYFGRCYDLNGAEIIDEGDGYVFVKKKRGIIALCTFFDFDYYRNSDGSLKSEIPINVRCMSSEESQKLINSWCYG